MKNISLEYSKLIKLRYQYEKKCEEFNKYLLKNIILTEEDKEEFGCDISSFCSVFYQPSDGFVIEINAHNAPLEKIILHIMQYGHITYEEYKNYRI